ncbi:lipid asymmetry maintenance protein MlaB [Azonexus sp.]|uniref:STAS domain-containing protein n=1 Tax=Azonexus sp. TaxID=1872668 RepID=UPI0027BAAB70|nr:STAS domain-containing protein [Azonexus sp.]
MISQSAGRLNIGCAMVMENARALLDSGRSLMAPGEVVFDLSSVEEADSSAVAVMLGWLRHAVLLRSTVCFVGVPAGVLSLAKLYGVAELLPQA